MKILVADDEPMVLKIVLRLLQFMKHEVLAAEDGPAALALLREHDDVDVAILDHNMPGMNGTEVLAQLREFRPKLPVLICTGERSLIFEDPLTGILEKPYRLEELERTLIELAG